jgi:hypothetical protein
LSPWKLVTRERPAETTRVVSGAGADVGVPDGGRVEDSRLCSTSGANSFVGENVDDAVAVGSADTTDVPWKDNGPETAAVAGTTVPAQTNEPAARLAVANAATALFMGCLSCA